jgi:hypothetical protein
MSWLTRLSSWLCPDCSKSSEPSTFNGAHLPTPEPSSLSRSVSQSSSLPAPCRTQCVNCQKTILKGSMGSNRCKKCETKNQLIEAKLAEVEAEKVRTQMGQVRKIGKPLFWKKIRVKIRTERVHRSSTIINGYITPKPPLDFSRFSESAKKSQAALSSRKRKHGKA